MYKIISRAILIIMLLTHFYHQKIGSPFLERDDETENIGLLNNFPVPKGGACHTQVTRTRSTYQNKQQKNCRIEMGMSFLVSFMTWCDDTLEENYLQLKGNFHLLDKKISVNKVYFGLPCLVFRFRWENLRDQVFTSPTWTGREHCACGVLRRVCS